MNILWITNILFPEAQQLLMGDGELRASGGWMLGAANVLSSKDDVKLSVATVSNMVKDLIILEGKQITYYIIPFGKGNLRINAEYNKYWESVREAAQPDVVHIHGTEYSHGHAFMKACGADKVVVSIQGLTSAYYYYYYGITKREVFNSLTVRDILRGSVIRDQKRFKARSKYEIEMIQMAKHIIGRTSWDRSHVWAINPDAQYHFCNEILRPEFYGGEAWSYDKCDKHTIFLSQAGYPIKGLHQVLKAMPLILRHYPSTTIRVAGTDITKLSASLMERLKITGYGKYIKRLIKHYGLEGKVKFIGNLNADEMKQEYLSANVFVCPSTIENSPNSLGEAQILGTPCVASYVGGVPDMMKGNEDNLYRFEEIEMLAEKICRIFANKGKQNDMRQTAMIRHGADGNAQRLVEIYKDIIF